MFVSGVVELHNDTLLGWIEEIAILHLHVLEANQCAVVAQLCGEINRIAVPHANRIRVCAERQTLGRHRIDNEAKD